MAVRNDTFTGHAFVMLYQQENHTAAEKQNFKVYGYYPKTIGTVPIPIGIVKNDSNCLKKISPNGDMYFIVDEAAYYEAKAVLERWTANPPPFTLIINCIDMLDEVAMSIGVNLPSRYNTIKSLVPEHYMKYLYKKLSSPKGIVYNKRYRIKLIEKVNNLSEVTALNSIFSRAQMMDVFKKQFIGKTTASKSCKIENENEIYFSYDKEKKML